MISFTQQRFSHFRSTITALFCVLLITPVLHGQSSDELFRGTWQIETPDEGALIIIVKSQGRASYFWGDNTDRTVYQGTWASDDTSVTLTWPDGTQHRIERDSLGYGITYIGANGGERYTAQAQQVPSEILGQWAKPPTKESEAVSDRDQAKGFFGIWKISGDDTTAEYVFVESDRSAASTEGGEGGLRGSWAKQGSELHITWDSGHYSIIRENKREFAYKRIAPGAIIEDDQSEMRPAVRTIEEKVPGAWISHYRQEREIDNEGIAFSSRKTARAFYRGDWIVQHDGNRFERIEITRFGGLNTSTERGLEGEWRMQGQDIFMRWDNGMRTILSPIGRGFVLYEYKPGRPLDGVPTRTRAAAPADSAKLAEHMKGRGDVAQQMIQLAEAAGIDPSHQEEAGWGRTFARWAWPFGEDQSAVSPEAILAEEYEAPRESDPWWWPFWSEKSASDTSVREAEAIEAPETPNDTELKSDPIETPETPETPELAGETVTDSEQTEEKVTGTEKKRSSVRDWVWPF